MGKKSTPKPPAAPDYAGAATAQGEANLEAARLGAELNNTNQVTPYGSQTFTKDPNSDQWTSSVTLSPEQQRIYDLQAQGDERLGQMANSQLDRINDTVSQPFDLSGAPDRVNSVGSADYGMYTGSGPQTSLYSGATPDYQRVTGGDAYQRVGASPTSSGYSGSQPDYQRAGAGPTYDEYTGSSMDMPDYAAQAKEVEDSLYRSSTARLDPEFQQRENSERTRLINAGVPEGSEAFNVAMDRFQRDRTAAYGDARDRAIQGRGAEQSRLNQDFYAGNAQKFGQDITKLNTNNQTRAQSYADAMRGMEFNNTTAARALQDQLQTQGFNNQAAQQTFADSIRGADFNNLAQSKELQDRINTAGFNNDAGSREMQDRLQTLGFNNATSTDQFNDQLKALGFNNQAEAQKFMDSIASGNFQNAQRGAAIDEQAYLRNEPLNLYSALASGSQVTQPQFRGTGAVAGPNAAPTFAATQASDQRAIDLYNAQLAGSGSAQSGLFGMMGNLGGAAIRQWSDRRLKTDIEQIGSLSTGLPVYRYKIFGNSQIGVMADEVRQIHPDAVTRHESGYDMVDYSKVAR